MASTLVLAAVAVAMGLAAERVAHWLVDRVGVVRDTLDGATAGPTFSGLARLIDGDTLEIRGTRVRLHGIDPPESAQRCRSGCRVWSCGRDAARTLVRRVSARGRSGARSATGTTMGAWWDYLPNGRGGGTSNCVAIFGADNDCLSPELVTIAAER